MASNIGEGIATGLSQGVAINTALKQQDLLEAQTANVPIQGEMLKNQASLTGSQAKMAGVHAKQQEEEAAKMNQTIDIRSTPGWNLLDSDTSKAEILKQAEAQGMKGGIGKRSDMKSVFQDYFSAADNIKKIQEMESYTAQQTLDKMDKDITKLTSEGKKDEAAKKTKERDSFVTSYHNKLDKFSKLNNQIQVKQVLEDPDNKKMLEKLTPEQQMALKMLVKTGASPDKVTEALTKYKTQKTFSGMTDEGGKPLYYDMDGKLVTAQGTPYTQSIKKVGTPSRKTGESTPAAAVITLEKGGKQMTIDKRNTTRLNQYLTDGWREVKIKAGAGGKKTTGDILGGEEAPKAGGNIFDSPS